VALVDDLVENKPLADLFEVLTYKLGSPQSVAAWVMTTLQGELKYRGMRVVKVTEDTVVIAW
jgi:Asp-tRNA(Asn)/Glu-tRNA(Gln) amidotransferase B subunit